MNPDKRRSKFDSSTTGSSRSPSELRMLHLIKPLDGAAGTVKPFRVSLVEPVAYPKPSYLSGGSQPGPPEVPISYLRYPQCCQSIRLPNQIQKMIGLDPTRYQY